MVPSVMNSGSLRHQRGFSLLEVLVSVVIMSVGILGVVGMQILSLQQNRSSLFRSEALLLAGGMLDRMRANRGQEYAESEFADGPPSASDCMANPCSAAAMANFDIAQWKCLINSEDDDGDTLALCSRLNATGSLPNGGGAISHSGDVVNVLVRWRDASDSSDWSSVSLTARID